MRGQQDCDGEYSLHSAGEDYAEQIMRITREEDNKKVDLLVHCSAILPLLDLPSNHALWTRVEQIVLYSYLATPETHLERFRRKCLRYGVNAAEDIGNLTHYTPSMYARIPVPLSIVHPLTPANLKRASVLEVEELAKAARPVEVRLPECGYNISQSTQRKLVDQIVSEHFEPLLSKSL